MKNIENLKIADVIGAIDGVEFQTDILALSVAVEAAGDEGHGTTVVAREMRSLAQASAQAASEIEAMIGEGVEKVESASKLLGDAGGRMRDIASQVRRLADMVGEIGSAGAGMTRIGGAIAQFDAITQRNAALAERCTAAAVRLEEQSDELARAVSAFKIGHRTHGDLAVADGLPLF